MEHAEKFSRLPKPAAAAKARLLGLLVAARGEDQNAPGRIFTPSCTPAPSSANAWQERSPSSAGGDNERLAHLIAIEIPGETHLEMARLSGNKVLQKQIAQIIIKSVTAISAAIGAQPIPSADFPILTSLQAAMVASIMHISGREMSPKLAGEFIAAVGANLGVGLALREGSRAIVKFVPFWGNAVSGAIAATGTYAMGRSATAYFIEGLSMKDAQRILKGRSKEPQEPLL